MVEGIGGVPPKPAGFGEEGPQNTETQYFMEFFQLERATSSLHRDLDAKDQSKVNADIKTINDALAQLNKLKDGTPKNYKASEKSLTDIQNFLTQNSTKLKNAKNWDDSSTLDSALLQIDENMDTAIANMSG